MSVLKPVAHKSAGFLSPRVEHLNNGIVKESKRAEKDRSTIVSAIVLSSKEPKQDCFGGLVVPYGDENLRRV